MHACNIVDFHLLMHINTSWMYSIGPCLNKQISLFQGIIRQVSNHSMSEAGFRYGGKYGVFALLDYNSHHLTEGK